MNIAFVGSGQVGGALAKHLQALGHTVTIAARDLHSQSVLKAQARTPGLRARPILESIRAADMVFFATPFSALTEVVPPLAEELAGKVVVDCTNPVGPGLSHGLASQQSGSQMLQALAPDARIVKAFTIYGFENFEDNRFPSKDVKPVMLYCGRDAEAKQSVRDLIDQMGWEPLDAGGLEQALHLEHLTLLWIRMVRMGGHSPHLVWAALTR